MPVEPRSTMIVCHGMVSFKKVGKQSDELLIFNLRPGPRTCVLRRKKRWRFNADSETTQTEDKNVSNSVNREAAVRIEVGAQNYRSVSMINVSNAFSSFSVNNIQEAREFYGKTLGLEVSSGPEGT